MAERITQTDRTPTQDHNGSGGEPRTQDQAPADGARIIRLDDRYQIFHGDWEDHAPEEVDHIISDPPFCDRVHSKVFRRNERFGTYRDEELGFDSIDARVLAPKLIGIANRWVVAFCSIEQIGDYAHAADTVGAWVRGCFWVKPNATPQFSGDRPAAPGEGIAVMHRPGKKRWNAGGKKGIYVHNTCRDKDRFHQTQKPLKLMMELIEDFTEPGDLVFDPFMGSGTTGVACLALGRRFIGCELDPVYFEKASVRLHAASLGLRMSDFENGQIALI